MAKIKTLNQPLAKQGMSRPSLEMKQFHPKAMGMPLGGIQLKAPKILQTSKQTKTKKG